jgi:hypothetical protein
MSFAQLVTAIKSMLPDLLTRLIRHVSVAISKVWKSYQWLYLTLVPESVVLANRLESATWLTDIWRLKSYVILDFKKAIYRYWILTVFGVHIPPINWCFLNSTFGFSL